MREPSWLDKRSLKRVIGHVDAKREAEKAMYRGIADYIAGATEDEHTLALNRTQFEDIGFDAKMGVWVPDPKLETTVLGQKLSMPIMTAPCGGMRLVHPDGDMGVALAAKAQGLNHILSSVSMYPMEEVHAAVPDAWFQLYKLGNEDIMWGLVDRARAAGYTVMVPTIDSQVASIRERDYRNGFNMVRKMSIMEGLKRADQLAWRPRWAYRFWRDGMPFQISNTVGLTKDGKPLSLGVMSEKGRQSHSPMWDDIAKIREQWDGKLVVKGVMSVHDAKKAVDLGADGIIISNHGGRQLEFGYTITQTVAEVAAAVGDQVEIMADSGVRRGTDVMKLLSLGARAVLIGRMSAWGLAIAGQAGVEHVIGRLRAELTTNMQLLGVESVQDLNLSHLRLPNYIKDALATA
jgi:isopentenyl diphosphate isomerase/L-lactate dehydrogenase-like FMN-dependent dehydrogenase